ncbi:hypothetical protein B0H14DRAFT_2639950 [Mycena olivaceomarginata]|nr:hypothetical protein B0H14DRAFT_2639950 [Mycena olivaceomarginata]
MPKLKLLVCLPRSEEDPSRAIEKFHFLLNAYSGYPQIGYDFYMFDYMGDDFTFDLHALVDGTMYTDMHNTYFMTNLDVMVNNAGINMTGKDTHTVDEAFFDRLININLKSVYYSITTCVPVMLKQKSGMFIHVSWVGALRPKPKIAYYCTTNTAIINISKSIAIEYTLYVHSVVIVLLMGNIGETA